MSEWSYKKGKRKSGKSEWATYEITFTQLDGTFEEKFWIYAYGSTDALNSAYTKSKCVTFDGDFDSFGYAKVTFSYNWHKLTNKEFKNAR